MAYEISNKIVSGRKAVNPAGTAVKLSATVIHCYRVDLCADINNANPVVVGGSGVVAAGGSQKGTVLIPGNIPHTILTNDVSKVWVDSITNGDAVVFTYYVE